MTLKKRTAILISGRGSNMRSLIEAAKNPTFPAEIVIVISNKPEAEGLVFAKENAIKTSIINHKAHPDRASFDQELHKTLQENHIELVCLAGFMRILSEEFVEKWHDRLINIHPSLLPAYKGLNTHQRVLEAGEKHHGCTVHFVIPELDAGTIILQKSIEVREGDTEATLSERVLREENKLYPEALKLVASGEISIKR